MIHRLDNAKKPGVLSDHEQDKSDQEEEAKEGGDLSSRQMEENPFASSSPKDFFEENEGLSTPRSARLSVKNNSGEKDKKQLISGRASVRQIRPPRLSMVSSSARLSPTSKK